jgi:Holliday junction DNA helicase RuvA
MISFIKGKIIDKDHNSLIALTSGGVGYKIFVKPTVVDDYAIGSEKEILTYLSVSETALNLYGFATEQERKLFLLFLNVSGIGPKSALHLLSLGSVDEISGAISRGDVEYLTKVSGVGRKTAERIVVELKSKINDLVSDSIFQVSDIMGDVVEGLVALGYSAQQAREVVKKLDANDKNSEQLMREALKNIK